MAQKHKLHRISVGLSDEEHAELLAMSENHRVSLAWLGRQAITEFLERCGKAESQISLNFPSQRKAAANG